MRKSSKPRFIVLLSYVQRTEIHVKKRPKDERVKKQYSPLLEQDLLIPLTFDEEQQPTKTTCNV